MLSCTLFNYIYVIFHGYVAHRLLQIYTMEPFSGCRKNYPFLITKLEIVCVIFIKHAEKLFLPQQTVDN